MKKIKTYINVISIIICSNTIYNAHATDNTTKTPVDSSQYPNISSNYKMPENTQNIKCAPNKTPTQTSQWIPYGNNGNQSNQAYQAAKNNCQANSPKIVIK